MDSRWNQRDIGAGATSRRSRVCERGLDEGTPLAVEPAVTSLKIGDGCSERAIAGEAPSSRKDATALDKSWLR